MRKIIAITQLPLDGVMHAPGGPEEDPQGGFTHGGWAMTDASKEMPVDMKRLAYGGFKVLVNGT